MWSDKWAASYRNTDGWDFVISDTPQRFKGSYTWWRAEASIMGYSGGSWEVLGTFTYGFFIHPGSGYVDGWGPYMVQPSNAHLNNLLKVIR